MEIGSGPTTVKIYTITRKDGYLEVLAMHRTMPTTASNAGRHVFIRSAWQAIDAAMASLDEIRFDAQQRRESGVQSV